LCQSRPKRLRSKNTAFASAAAEHGCKRDPPDRSPRDKASSWTLRGAGKGRLLGRAPVAITRTSQASSSREERDGPAPRGVDGVDAPAEAELDTGVPPEPGRAEEKLAFALRAGQVLLGRGGPLVRCGRLVADDDEAALETLGAEGLRRAGAR
jgi:hypothetical protein